MAKLMNILSLVILLFIILTIYLIFINRDTKILFMNNKCHLINKNLYNKLKISNKKYKYNIYIVYFINCNLNKNYLEWLKNDLKYVLNLNSNIYVMATCNSNDEKKIKNSILNKNVKFYFNENNLYEYPGIKMAWDLGQIYNKKTDIILYYHSKQITHFKHYNNIYNFIRFNKILTNIDTIKDIFSSMPQIDKIGNSCSETGWVWYNVWYVRGSYINTVEKPKITDNRYYYEDWISRSPKNNKNSLCYSFDSNILIGIGNIGYYYDPNIDKYKKLKY